MYPVTPRNFLKEIISIPCFQNSKSQRPCQCCKKIILNIIITLASYLPSKTVLLKNTDSKMIQKISIT